MLYSIYQKIAWGLLPSFVFAYCVLSLTVVSTANLSIAGSDFLSGGLSQKFEDNYRGAMPWRDNAIDHVSALRYRLLKEARSGAVVGHGDRLFTEEEFLAKCLRSLHQSAHQ